MTRPLRLILTLLALVALSAGLAACGDDDDSGAASSGTAPDAPALKVALLTSGLTNDGGFNQWAAEAFQALEKEGKVTLQVRQQLADPNAAEPVLREFASRGYDLVVGHGIELSAPVLKVAAQFPDVKFATTGDNTLADKLIANVEGWTYDFGQFGYVNGFVAGLVEDVEEIGLVSGPQIPFVQAGQKGFEAGVKATNPDATVESVYTGGFYEPQKEQEAVRALADGGAKVIGANTAEGNGIAPAAKTAGVQTVGVAVAGSAASKDVNITSARLDFASVYQGYVTRLGDGTFGKKFEVGTLANRQIVIEPVNTATGASIPDDLQARVDDLADQLKSGELTLPNFFE